MAAKRPAQPASRQELLNRLAAERQQPAAQPQQPLRVADLLANDLSSRVDCPHPRQLEDLVAGRLPSKRRPALVEHLNACPSCRRYVVGLRDACTGPAPTMPLPRTTSGLGMSHVIGLAVAGMLLLLANSKVIDLLDSVEAPAAAVVQPADRASVAPAPVVAAPVMAPQPVEPNADLEPVADDNEAVTVAEEAEAEAAANVSERESLTEPVGEQTDE